MVDWFAGEGRDADEEVFVAELRRLASTEGLLDVRPHHTAANASPDFAWFVFRIGIPGLPDEARPELQIGFASQPPVVDPLVACWETHGYLLDQWEALSSLEADTRAMARFAFRWLREQLARPVERWEWPRRFGRGRSHYVLADTGQVLWTTGTFEFREPRGAPRRTRLR